MNVYRRGDWRPLALRGTAALLLGVVTALRPEMDTFTLALVFGGYAVVDGVIAVGVSLSFSGRRRRWLHAVEGLVGVGYGLAAFAIAHGEQRALAFVVAGWAVASGACEMGTAQRVDGARPADLLLLSEGVVSVLAGVVAALLADKTVMLFVFFLGSSSLVFGTVLVLLADGVRRRGAERLVKRAHRGRPSLSWYRELESVHSLRR